MRGTLGRSIVWGFLFFVMLFQISPAKKPPVPLAVIDSLAAGMNLSPNKVTYVDFWASWCPPCKKSFPWMKALQEKYRDQGLQIIAVSVDKDPGKARQFLADQKAQFNVIYDSTGSLATKYNLDVIPTSYVYARDGQFRTMHEGFDTEDTLKLNALINSMLKETTHP